MKKSILFFLFLCPVMVFAQNTSIYTDIKPQRCRMLDSHSEGATWACNGAAGYKLIHASDFVSEITLVSPRGTQMPLSLGEKLQPGWSSVGNKAEWRMRQGRPVALIVRYDIGEEGESRRISYLVVARIEANNACMVGKVPPGRNQNVLARQMADAAQNMSCR